MTPSTFPPPAETSEIRAALTQARFYAAHPGTFFRQLPAIVFRRLPTKAYCRLTADYLRGLHELHLGDSRELLPRLLARYPRIDLFFHDSLHTFEHMSFAYHTAWPHLTDGGILASDDILWNTAFAKFCRGKGKRYVRVGAAGAVRKS